VSKGNARRHDNEAAPDVMDEGVDRPVSTAAILVARIRNRERVMANIAERNPMTYQTNPHYTTLRSAVVAYRDALAQLERRVELTETEAVLA
jgi:hypothetical protein